VRTAAALAAAALALAGCGSSSSGVSAGSYVKSVCGATQGFKQGGQSAVSQYTAAVSKAKTVADVKQQLQTYLGSMVAAADRFDTQLKAAGVPNVKNGQQFASTLRTAFGQVRTAFAQAQTQVSQLATNSVPAFRTAAANVRATLNQADTKLRSLDLTKNAELHDAALKDSTCKALKTSP
jgi:hypothetical protein